ncbi:RNA polymerase sigma factor [Fontivita pretiosa]|uniref:RNA polymerase sigma factor n=1 Tax=Fontivita pretiosa TaxID=2989684 RepID=UPI003D165A65
MNDSPQRDQPERGPKKFQTASPQVTAELFDKAVRQHSRRLLAIARAIVGNRASPEDVVQQALTNLYQHRMRYDWREPGGLLKRAVVNEALRLLRHPRMSLVEEDHPETHSNSPVQGMIDSELTQQVRKAISRLPDHFRAALVLCEYENLSYVEIAQSLGASVPQVKTWIHRARRQMEEMLRPYVKVRD